ncbi:Holliday junction resolvase MOC1, chloroplastic [Coccomyxa sp. Obi]|nr:Holliday junction resolvase MOC1, chloroplastic [Coccomyxa sp. Obi]
MLRTPAGLSVYLKRLGTLPLSTGVRKTSLAGRQQSVVKNSSHATLIKPILGPDALSISNHSSVSGKLEALQRPPVIIGIDPDSNGALAVIEVQSYPQPGAQVIEDVVVRLHDNPCEVLQATKQRKRRQADSTAIASIVRSLAAERCSSDSQDARVVLEMPQPNRLNGKWSWYACGHSFGVWHGALTSQGFKVETVTSRAWKIDLQLNGKGKEGSRLLAIRLFPTAADLLKRKKDHGRAEAMLIAAWALGLRIQPDSGDVTVVPPVETQEASLDDLLSEEDADDTDTVDS